MEGGNVRGYYCNVLVYGRSKCGKKVLLQHCMCKEQMKEVGIIAASLCMCVEGGGDQRRA